MQIAVVHNALSAESTPDDRDVVVQAKAVGQALAELGHEPATLTCDLDLSAVRKRLETNRPDLVFNLVESLCGTGRLISLFPGLLDALHLPYTGAGTDAVFLTSNKVLAKSRMHAAGLPTPSWVGAYSPAGQFGFTDNDPARRIIKSVWEHASIGLDEQAIVSGRPAEGWSALLSRRAPLLGGDCFAEVFIEGREFNLSVLDGVDGPRVLPPAEIIFEGYGEHKACIVDYRAKWDDTSYEYHHTPRRFDFETQDRVLLEELKSLALACWDLFALKGYARVDFRVDNNGRPWILEVNANPCISPDAGFAAAVEQAGLSYTEAVRQIVAVASPQRLN